MAKLKKPNVRKTPSKVIKLSRWQRFKGWFNKARSTSYTIFGVIVLIIGALQAPQVWDYYKDKCCTSPHDKFHDKYYSSGVIQSPVFTPAITGKYAKSSYELSSSLPNFELPVNYKKYPHINGIPIWDLKKTPYLFVFVSGYFFTCLPEDLERGIDILNPTFTSCYAPKLILGVKDNKLYISIDLKDLNDNYMASIRFNHWEIYNPNVLDYNDSDPKKLEIKDRQNHIVLSLSYEDHGMVMIGGYLMGDKSIVVLPNDPKKSKSIHPFCVLKADSDWKQKALQEIVVVKSVYSE